jgi:exopolysaccharide biosynthesis polyprenyl glycosylphosphotransferase
VLKLQPDIVHARSLADSQDQYGAEHELLSVEKNHSLQVAVAVDEFQELLNPQAKEIGSLEGLAHLQESQVHKHRQRWRPSSTIWHLALLIGDDMLLIATLVLVLPLPSHMVLNESSGIFGPWNANFVWLCLVLASWSFAASITQAQQLHCATSVLKSPLYVLFSLVLMLIFCALLLYLILGSEVISSMRTLLYFLILAASILCIWRVALARIINVPRFRRLAVILGVNAAGRSVARELLSAKHPNVNLMGYIGEGIDLPEQRDGLPILGGRSALRSLVQNRMIDMIIMATDYKADPELFQEALEGAQRGITVAPVTAVYESTSGKIPVEHISDQWYTALPVEQLVTPFYVCWRKAMDLAFGVGGFVFLCLILPPLSLLIYLNSPGPIFYSQERVGLWGKPFRIYKFRSMRSDAEHNGRAIWAIENDTRVTGIGRFMRATHLDELPQVFNILRGDMSLIGPRPEREELAVELEKIIPFYRCRLAVKPGLTGWAQVKYSYAGTENDTLIKLQYDLYYIKHRSFMLDIFITLMTFVEVFLHRGT